MDTIYNGDGQTSNTWRDRVSGLHDLCGFRFVPLGLESTSGIRVYYLNVYCTEKAMTTHSHEVGCFTHLPPSSLFPKNISATLLKLEQQSKILKECSDLGHVGAARLEARVAFSDASRVLIDIPSRLTQDCIANVLPETLWYVIFIYLLLLFIDIAS